MESKSEPLESLMKLLQKVFIIFVCYSDKSLNQLRSSFKGNICDVNLLQVTLTGRNNVVENPMSHTLV
jgi:hypothetical protein